MGLFSNGATWLRADFHLHTNTDHHFDYSGDTDYYYSAYVDALVKAGICVGVITNHNKFDFEEFDALRKTAKRKDVFLLPGVELSVSDGKNGVHMLVVFSDEWLENGNDRISPFISSMFPGKAEAEYQSEDGRSDKSILQAVEVLDQSGLDYFLIFPHVHDRKGLWEELGGGRLQDWQEKRYQDVKARTLGFQKVRTSDKKKQFAQWLGDWYPAEVEGSDPKNIEQIGQGKQCYIKIGACTFDAVKFALADHKNRLRLNTPPQCAHSHIRQISFVGGTLDGQTIRFSPELNTLIGIRGSGKSSIMEALRFVLGMPLINEKGTDYEYKEQLTRRTLGSGGKVILDVTDCYGLQYRIQRSLGGNPTVLIDDKLQPGVSIRETVLRNPLFFGQKELAASEEGSEKEFIEKLLGTKCYEIRRQIAIQNSVVVDAINKLSKIDTIDESIEEQKLIIQDSKFRLGFYKEHGLEEKLQRRLGFESDIRRSEKGILLIEKFVEDINELLARHEDELRNYPGYKSPENAAYFKKYDEQFLHAVKTVESIKAELAESEMVLDAMKEEHEKLIEMKNNLTDEFAAIERTLANELVMSTGQNISTDDFLAVKNKLAAAEATLTALEKSNEQKQLLLNELDEALHILRELWQKEYQLIKDELDGFSVKHDKLKFSTEYQANKQAFLDHFKNIFRGSRIWETTLSKIVEKYQDFAGIYWDLENDRELFGSNFITAYKENLKDLLTYQVPNKYTITYRGTELSHHSLGQRASALMLFLLDQRENDVIIIDQPEDDLDNQTIYEDVIKLIQKLKPSVQFIFATHNPNIPVLGDAEQIHSCSLAEYKIDVQSGGIDDLEQQKRIVSIMEGGEDAFRRRKEIYNSWKS